MAVPQYRPDATRHLPAIGEITEENPELLMGYLVVAIRIDGTVSIAHNTSCIGCLIADLVVMLKNNPDMQCASAKQWKWLRRV